MPAFSDDFAGTTGALLRQRSGWTYAGSATFQDRATISNNRVKAGGSSGLTNHYCYGRDAGEAAQWIEAKLLRATGLCPGLYVRWVDANNFIQVRGNGTTVELIKRVAGTITTVASLTSSLAANDVLRIAVTGSTVRLWRNGAVLGAAGGYAVADGALASATIVGLGGEGSVASAETFDDCSGGGLTAAVGPADGRSAGRGDAAAVALRLKVFGADGRSASRGDAGGVAVRLRLFGADGRSVGRGDATGLALRLKLFGADGRSAARADAGAVAIRLGLVPADGRSVSRGDAVALGLRLGLGPGDARSSGRAEAGGLGLRIGLAGADARSGSRSDAAGLSPQSGALGVPGAGVAMAVGAEQGMTIFGESVARVGGEYPLSPLA